MFDLDADARHQLREIRSRLVGVGIHPAGLGEVRIAVPEGIHEPAHRLRRLEVPLVPAIRDEVSPLLAVAHDGAEGHHRDGARFDLDDLMMLAVPEPMLRVARRQGDLGLDPGVRLAAGTLLDGPVLPAKHLAVDERPGVVVRPGVGDEPEVLSCSAVGRTEEDQLDLDDLAVPLAVGTELRNHGGRAEEGASLKRRAAGSCLGGHVSLVR